MKTFAGLLALFTILLLNGASRAATPSWETIATDKIKDMTATLVVQDVNRDELRKIGGSFATTYSIKRMNMAYQQPNKARFEARFLGAQVLMVYNGDTKKFHIPGRTETKNIAGQPGQKQTLMDLGIFAKDYLTTDYEAHYLRTEGDLQVYKLSQRNTTNTSHEIVWVNPKTSIIEKRQSYNGDNKFIKEIRFTNPAQPRPGIYVPTRIEIYNTEGKMGAAQSIEEIKVNLGVDASQFETS
jgi:outer membrane lipoprotein-sorting protein